MFKRLFKLRIDVSRLFHSRIADGKKEFLKKVRFKVKTGYIAWWSCDARAGFLR